MDQSGTKTWFVLKSFSTALDLVSNTRSRFNEYILILTSLNITALNSTVPYSSHAV